MALKKIRVLEFLGVRACGTRALAVQLYRCVKPDITPFTRR